MPEDQIARNHCVIAIRLILMEINKRTSWKEEYSKRLTLKW